MTDQNTQNQTAAPTVVEEVQVLSPLKAQIDSYFDSVSETFISWQLPYESEIFKILNMKRTFEKLPDDERIYFRYYVYTFRMELLSGFVTLPVGYLTYKYKSEMNKSIKDITKVNRYLKLLFLVGVPSINLFLVSFYRRYFYKHQYEDQLKLRYVREIRDVKKSEKTQSS